MLVGKEVGPRSVVLVRARFCRDRNLHRTAATVLHAERVGLNRHFLNGIRVGRQVRRSQQNVTCDIQTVDGELVAAVIASISAGIDSLFGGKIVRRVARCAVSNSAMTRNAGCNCHETQKVAPLNRKVLQLLGTHSALQTGVARIDCVSLGADGDLRTDPGHV